MALIDTLRTVASDAGLDAVGVCDSAPFESVGDDIRSRVEHGHHGGLSFTYRDPELSTDIARSLPWVRRLVVGIRRYLPEAPAHTVAPGRGRVARFATADHYRPLRRGLADVAEVLRSEGHRTDLLVDDNRLVDRAAAVRAGVAWWGKSTMVLSPRLGPWFLIGSVATDAELPVDGAMRRDCGTCTACIPACPTGAIVAPGVLDASRCLSAVLQRPGSIPPVLREAVGTRFYGCDDCLDACPPGHRLLDDEGRIADGIDLIEVLAMDDRALRARFSHFFVPRNQARFLRRNALVALGNGGGPRAFEVCTGYLGHPDPLLRRHAAWAVGRLDAPGSRRVLETASLDEHDDEVRQEIAAALGSLG